MITYHSVRTTDLKNVLHTASTRSEFLRLLTPVRHLLVVNNVVGAESLELLAFLGRRSSGDDLGSCRFGKLHGEHADTTGTLGKNPVTRLQATALQTVQAVPRGETGTCEGAALQEVEVGGHADESLLVESAILLQGSVDGAADAGRYAVEVERAGKMGLVEEGQDFVALLEASYASTDFFDDTSAIRCRYYAFTLGERVEALDDGEIAVVEGRGVDC
jgi:hypothetical protein